MMARVELRKTWVVAGDTQTIADKLRAFLKKHKMRFDADGGSEIQAKQGSQFLTRLLGGWFVPAAWLPKRAKIILRQTATGVEIHASIEESLGIGFLDPLLKDKYRKYFEEWIDKLPTSLT